MLSREELKESDNFIVSELIRAPNGFGGHYSVVSYQLVCDLRLSVDFSAGRVFAGSHHDLASLGALIENQAHRG